MGNGIYLPEAVPIVIFGTIAGWLYGLNDTVVEPVSPGVSSAHLSTGAHIESLFDFDNTHKTRSIGCCRFTLETPLSRDSRILDRTWELSFPLVSPQVSWISCVWCQPKRLVIHTRSVKYVHTKVTKASILSIHSILTQLPL